MNNTFYVIDFDRCLGRPEKFQVLLEIIIERETTVSKAMIAHARQKAQETGGSFDTATYVRETLRGLHQQSDRVWRKIETMFINEAQGQDMLEPYAKRLLEILDDEKIPYGILTYGGEEWQSAKIAASGLKAVPHLVTSTQEKGLLFAQWRQSDGSFELPVQLAGVQFQKVQSVVFLDDKPVSFVGIPKEVRGICVLPMTNTESPLYRYPIPKGVQIVHGMKEAIALLFNKI